jgi:hypothetical protein
MKSLIVLHFSANFTLLPADKGTATDYCPLSLIAIDRLGELA